MYRAQFYRYDGARRTDIGSSLWLRATTVGIAKTAALALSPPAEAQFIDVSEDERVISTLSLGNVIQLRVIDPE